jgi:hypothetical protein
MRGFNARWSVDSRATSLTNWTSAADKSILLGSRSMFGTAVLRSTSSADMPRSMRRL